MRYQIFYITLHYITLHYISYSIGLKVRKTTKTRGQTTMCKYNRQIICGWTRKLHLDDLITVHKRPAAVLRRPAAFRPTVWPWRHSIGHVLGDKSVWFSFKSTKRLHLMGVNTFCKCSPIDSWRCQPSGCHSCKIN